MLGNGTVRGATLESCLAKVLHCSSEYTTGGGEREREREREREKGGEGGKERGTSSLVP